MSGPAGTPPYWRPHRAASSGAEDTSVGRGRKPARWAWFLAVFTVPVVLVVFSGFVTVGWFQPSVLDKGAVQAGVRQILRDSYGLEAVGSVSCPSGQPVRPGHGFTCEVSIAGENERVRVVVRDEKGSYAVRRPE